MPKNGYRPVEVNPYAQQRYTSYYIPQVYSPQQQFPLYSLITPQAWSATHSFIDPTLVSFLLTCRNRKSRKVDLIATGNFNKRLVCLLHLARTQIRIM